MLYSPVGMPIQRCPSCDRPTLRLMDETIRDAAVNYYRCRNCDHIWTTTKDGDAIVEHLTPLTKKTDAPTG